jgi:hypothetical protein
MTAASAGGAAGEGAAGEGAAGEGGAGLGVGDDGGGLGEGEGAGAAIPHPYRSSTDSVPASRILVGLMIMVDFSSPRGSNHTWRFYPASDPSKLGYNVLTR